MTATILVFAIIGGVLHLGDGAYSAPLMVLTLTVTVFGVLAGGVALDDLANLKSDMTDEIRATGYGKGIEARDFGKLKMISSTLIGLTGLASVLAILL
jgi:hypothetical protein